jgi:DNA-binding cell septation regulator SpoVG
MISEVQVTPIKPKNGLVAFASVVLDGNWYLGSIGVHSRLDGQGFRLTYPTKRIGSKDLNIYHPLNIKTSKEIEVAIFDKLKNVMKLSNDRYNRSHNQ